MQAIKLFAHFTAIWGHKWVSAISDKDVNKLALKHWQQILDELTPNQINQACIKARATLDWPPSIAQFKKMALGILSAEQEFLLALDHNPQAKFRFLIRDYSWRSMETDKLRKEFYAKYDMEIQKSSNSQDKGVCLLD